MGLFDRMKERAAEREQAEVEAVRLRAEQEVQRRADEEARLADARLDPRSRLDQPEWSGALALAGVTPELILDLLDGSNGEICTPVSPGEISMGSTAGPGVVVLTTDGRLVYLRRSHGEVVAVTRKGAEVDQLRKKNNGNGFHVVFKGDRFFADRGGQPHRADYWEIRVPPRQEHLELFRRAGCDV